MRRCTDAAIASVPSSGAASVAAAAIEGVFGLHHHAAARRQHRRSDRHDQIDRIAVLHVVVGKAAVEVLAELPVAVLVHRQGIRHFVHPCLRIARHDDHVHAVVGGGPGAVDTTDQYARTGSDELAQGQFWQEAHVDRVESAQLDFHGTGEPVADIDVGRVAVRHQFQFGQRIGLGRRDPGADRTGTRARVCACARLSLRGRSKIQGAGDADSGQKQESRGEPHAASMRRTRLAGPYANVSLHRDESVDIHPGLSICWLRNPSRPAEGQARRRRGNRQRSDPLARCQLLRRALVHRQMERRRRSSGSAAASAVAPHELEGP